MAKAQTEIRPSAPPAEALPPVPPVPRHGPAANNVNTTGGQQEASMSFSDLDVRRGFIRKAFSILLAQHLIVTVIITFCVLSGDLEMLLRSSAAAFWALSIGALVFSLGIFGWMVLSEKARRMIPLNFACLLLVTLFFGYNLGFIGSLFDLVSMIQAGMLATVQCFQVLVYVVTTKTDLKGKVPYLYVCLVAWGNCVLMALVRVWSLTGISFLSLIGFSALSLVVSLYLVYDVKLIVRKKHVGNITPEEYVMVGVILYVDIANIFFNILALFKNRRSG